MSEELVQLIKPELEEVAQIIKKSIKAEFTLEGKLPLTGFKVTTRLMVDDPKLPFSNEVSRFYLTQFPGNCGMMITHETYQSIDYRKKGLSVPIQRMKAKIARHFNYTILLATTVPSNANDNVLTKAGFVKIDPLCFTSRRTANKITTWMKVLD